MLPAEVQRALLYRASTGSAAAAAAAFSVATGADFYRAPTTPPDCNLQQPPLGPGDSDTT